MAVVAVVIVIVLIAVGVSSCQSSARKSAIQDYGNSVNRVIGRSQATSNTLFGVLAGGVNSSNVTTASQRINQARATAETVLSDAQGLSVPSAAKTANSRLVLALQMRLDGITDIANEIQPAVATSVTKDAVDRIAGDMADFYASDVLYKKYVAPAVVSALHANGIAVGGADGVTLSAKQFLQSLDWLRPQFVAHRLSVSLSSGGSSGKVNQVKPGGVYGHSLTGVTVGGTALQPGSTNTVAASPAPTFTINFDNGGDSNETDVTCKVAVTGTSSSGTAVVPETFAHKTASCKVTLSSSPPTGTTYNVVVTIAKVPGETTTSNNTETIPVTFN